MRRTTLSGGTLVGKELPYEGADGDGDGVITNADYAVWKTSFGARRGAGEAGANTQVVPRADDARVLDHRLDNLGAVPTRTDSGGAAVQAADLIDAQV